MTAALTGGPLRGEIIAPGEGLTIIVVPHPLLMQSIPVQLAAGLTVAEIAAEARKIAGPQFRFRFVALLPDGSPITQELWARVRPKPGTVLVMRAVAEFGGDNNLLRTVLGAAVTIAGAFATTINPLLGAAITVGGQLAINALFPVAQPSLANQDSKLSQTYSISGGQNAADPYGVVPEIEGRHRYYPKLGAKWYTEFVGADQYLIGLVVWGYGPKEVTGIKLGETPIESFDDVQIETRLGYPDDAPVTLYPNEVEQEDLSVEITVAGGPQLRTTAANIDVISLDVVAPSGILRVDGSGAAQTYTVVLRAEYRAAGSADPWQLLGTLTFNGRSADQIRQGLRLAVPNGQYDVQITKTSADYTGTDQVNEQVVWSALRGIRNAVPIQFGVPLAHTAIRIRATSQLSGVIDSLNGIVATHCKAFDGAAWVDDTASSNPADLFRHVLQGPANARPKTDAQINIANIERWWAYNVANGFTCNIVFDSPGSVMDRLTAIAATGRAAVKRTDGMYDVIWDEPAAPIVQHFTPRNSSGFSSQRSYPKPPHAFRVRFVNADAGYAQDERIVYADGYNADGSDGKIAASLFESVEFPGVVFADLIWRHGRFHIAQAKLRPEQYQLTADFEWLVAQRGDRVRVTHDVVLWGLGSGRVKTVTPAEGEAVNDGVTLDEPVTMEDGKAYSIRFRLADGSSVLRLVTTVVGEQRELVLTGHGDLPAAGDLFMFGLVDAESVVARVLSIRPGPDFSALLTLVDDAPEISLADQGDIPAFDSHITIPTDPFTAAPIQLAVSEAFEGVDGATATGALFSWETTAGEVATGFEVEHRDDDGDGVYRADGSVAAPSKAKFLPGLLRGTWSFRVRCVFEDGSTSMWAELAHVDITAGAGLALPDVINFVTSFKDSTSALTWDEVKYLRQDVRYEIRKGDSWESGLVVGDLAHPPFTTVGEGTYWIAAKAQPLPGITIYSEHPTSLAIAGSILVRNVVATRNEHEVGWTGVITGPAVVDGEVVKTTDAGLVYYELEAGRFFDVGFLRRTRVEASWKAVGVPVDENVLADPDFLHNPDVLSAGSSAYIEAWPEISVAGDLDSDVFAAGDVFASPDVFAGAAVFAPYQKFAPGEYYGRFIKMRIAMRSNDPSVFAALTEFTVTADVPDRLDNYTGLAVPGGGVTVTFKPNGFADTKPFNAGPGTDVLPHYQITLLDGVAGDQLVIVSLTVAAITFKYQNGGGDVARHVNLTVQGW